MPSLKKELKKGGSFKVLTAEKLKEKFEGVFEEKQASVLAGVLVEVV